MFPSRDARWAGPARMWGGCIPAQAAGRLASLTGHPGLARGTPALTWGDFKSVLISDSLRRLPGARRWGLRLEDVPVLSSASSGGHRKLMALPVENATRGTCTEQAPHSASGGVGCRDRDGSDGKEAAAALRPKGGWEMTRTKREGQVRSGGFGGGYVTSCKASPGEAVRGSKLEGDAITTTAAVQEVEPGGQGGGGVGTN